MTQQGNTVNLFIHSNSGQPQVFKVVQASSANAAKTLFKTPSQDGAQGPTVITSGGQVLRTISLQGKPSRVLTIPIQASSPMKVTAVKTEPTLLPKTVQISGSPMLISPGQRLETQQMLQTVPQKTLISPIVDHLGSRKRQELESDIAPDYKRRKTEKVGKGLRHFSMKVCEKVRKKGTTSYNEVADELVSEFTNPALSSPNSEQSGIKLFNYDQKNIRRRVYDALNVLMAMNIISKEKKEIRWLGLPTNSLQECINLEREKQKRLERIKIKTQKLHELILQQISFKNLVERNRAVERQSGPPPPNSSIQLPFIIVNTSKKTVIDCSISNDKTEYLFQFDDKFEIHDDIEVLKRMGMALGLDKGDCSDSNLQKAKSMVPKSLENYVLQLAHSRGSAETVSSTSYHTAYTSEELEANLAVSELSRQSSQASMSDPPSPSLHEFSEESEAESDLEVN